MRPALDEALRLARSTVDVALGLTPPVFEREPRLVALHHPREYPMNEGRIVSNDGLALAPQAWGEAFHEVQVPWSNALQARDADGLPYLLGPAARMVLDHDQLHPLAREALEASGALESIRRNPYRSIVARAIELVQAAADAIDIVDAYVPPESPAVAWTPRPGTAGSSRHVGVGCRGGHGRELPRVTGSAPGIRARRVGGGTGRRGADVRGRHRHPGNAS